jgi:DNA-binding PadR family transcriptional regulator
METIEIKPAKLCFEHIGGKLGELLLNAFIQKQWIAKQNPLSKHFYITEKGKKEFTELGIDLSQIKPEHLEISSAK